MKTDNFVRNTKIMILGTPAMVEAAHAPYFLKKNALVMKASDLQKQVCANPQDKNTAYELGRTMGKIIRLNRKMKCEGMFCTILK